VFFSRISRLTRKIFAPFGRKNFSSTQTVLL
jgi:hypothetical protein